MNTKEKILLDGVTATTTSKPLNIEEFKGVGLQFVASGITSGNCVFTAEGTIDGTNWKALNIMVTNVSNTGANDLTREANITLSADGTDFLWLEEQFNLKAIRVTGTVTTDGTYSAFAITSS